MHGWLHCYCVRVTMCGRVDVCMHAYMHACTYIYMCVCCVYIHIDHAHARTHAHTHTHTHVNVHAYTGAGRMDAVSHRQSGSDIRAALRRRPCVPILCLARTGTTLSDSPFIRLCFEKWVTCRTMTCRTGTMILTLECCVRL